MSEERFSLKDHLFNRDTISHLSGLLESGVEGFNRDRFESAVMAEMLELELKERIALIASKISDQLDSDFERAAAQIRASLPPPLDPTLSDDDFGDFIIAPLGKYVEDHGLDHYEISMGLIRDLTMRFSMEGPVRAFINKEPVRTLSLFAKWATDDNYHVRRLVSEGTRPRLPWAPRIDLEIRAPLPLLDVLHSDPTRYVTRSVANHLNDISKIEPGLVIETLDRWHGLKRQEPKELQWMTRHSLRTLVKHGEPEAMKRLGYSPEPRVSAVVREITPVVRPGENLELVVELSAETDVKLMIDYTVDFVKKDGSKRSKVFKLKRLSLDAGEVVELSKRHPLRANATTYTLYPGTHDVTIVANGMPVAEAEFELAMD